MRTAALIALALAIACSGEPDPPPVVPDDCLPTDAPAGVSLEIATDAGATGALEVDAHCDVAGARTSGNERRLFLADCDDVVTTATIAIASIPVVTIAIEPGERVRLRYRRIPDGQFESRAVAIFDEGDRLAVGLGVGPLIPDGDFFGAVAARPRETECGPVPQGCFDAVRSAVEITVRGTAHVVPSRHTLDEGPLHVRVEQADRFEGAEACGVPAGWYDFVVTLDRS